jgi:protein TonB
VFYIEKDGSLTDIQVIEDEFNVGQDAVRIMKLMPSWNPAMHNGYIVRSRFTIPIKIRVN